MRWFVLAIGVLVTQLGCAAVSSYTPAMPVGGDPELIVDEDVFDGLAVAVTGRVQHVTRAQDVVIRMSIVDEGSVTLVTERSLQELVTESDSVGDAVPGEYQFAIAMPRGKGNAGAKKKGDSAEYHLELLWGEEAARTSVQASLAVTEVVQESPQTLLVRGTVTNRGTQPLAGFVLATRFADPTTPGLNHPSLGRPAIEVQSKYEGISLAPQAQVPIELSVEVPAHQGTRQLEPIVRVAAVTPVLNP